jgi:hypothetical protein
LKRLASFTISGSYRNLAKILNRLGKNIGLLLIMVHSRVLTLADISLQVNFLNKMGQLKKIRPAKTTPILPLIQ